VLEFTERLQRGEKELLSDLNRATDIMMGEGVRNSLRVTCQQLGLWPPVPTPAGVEANDCFYFDAQADVPVVAQRLYNDERRRAHVLASTGLDLEHMLAATASFLVDFAYEAGAALPSMPRKHTAFLTEFASNVGDWERADTLQKGQVCSRSERAPFEQDTADWTATDIAQAADLVRMDIKKWLDRTLHLPVLSASL